MPAPDSNRLNDLKRRWAQDPGSRLYLQLADEHRKHGQLAEAESVLVKGLEHRPSDLSGLVALGRCRLELGEVDEAITVLETVLARDPAHMVANKLLIEAHLQRGDGEQAGQRLETYRLFNDRDPELAHFDDRLRQLSGGSFSTVDSATVDSATVDSATVDSAAVEPAAVEPAAVEPAAAEPEPPLSGEPPVEAAASEIGGPAAAEPERVEAEPEAAEPAVEPEAAEPEAVEPQGAEPEAVGPGVAEPQPVAAVSIPRAAPSNGGTPHRDEVFYLGAVPAAPSLEVLWRQPPPARLAEPFSGLIAGSAAGALTRGDVFRVEPPAAEPPPPAEEPPAVEEPPPAVDEEAPTERIEIAEPPAPPPAVAAVADARPADEMPTEKVGLRPPDVEAPAPPVVEEPSAVVAATAAAAVSAAAALTAASLADEPPADEPSADAAPTEKVEIRLPAAEPPPVAAEAAAEERLPEPQPEPAEPAAAAADREEGEAATVTLGGLYLQQGHHDEAAKIFEQVLEQDPSNTAARAGLNLARRPPAAPLTAMDLLADRSLSGTLPMGLTARKLQVLTNYLKHIRSVRERDHVH